MGVDESGNDGGARERDLSWETYPYLGCGQMLNRRLSMILHAASFATLVGTGVSLRLHRGFEDTTYITHSARFLPVPYHIHRSPTSQIRSFFMNCRYAVCSRTLLTRQDLSNDIVPTRQSCLLLPPAGDVQDTPSSTLLLSSSSLV